MAPNGKYAFSGSGDRTLRLWQLTGGTCIRTFVGHTDGITSVAFAPDGQSVISASQDKSLRLWHHDWEPDIRSCSDWDERAGRFLEIFLTLHTDYSREGLVRMGKARWNRDDFQVLLKDLRNREYGRLPQEEVRGELDKMGRHWRGPRDLSKSFAERRRERRWYHKKAVLMPLSFLKEWKEAAEVPWSLWPEKNSVGCTRVK